MASGDARVIEREQTWLPLVVVSVSGLVCIFNIASATTTIGAVVADLHTTVSSVQLALVAYTIVIAAFVVDGGKLSARLGVVLTQRVGLGIYALGMAVAGFAPSVGYLVAGQAIAGLGGALLTANGVAILGQAYVGPRQTFAVSIQAGLTGLGVSLGLLLGGLLVRYVGWRAPFHFLLTVLFVIFALAGRMRVPRPERVPPRLDLVSVGLVAAGVLLLVGGVNQIGAWGLLIARPDLRFRFFGLSPVALLLLGGAMTLRVFVERQRLLRRRSLDPLLAPEIAASPAARACLTSLMVAHLLLAGVGFLLLMYSQIVLGHGAVESALTLLPVSLAMLVGSVAPGLLGRNRSPRALLTLATILAASGTFLLAATVGNDAHGPAFWGSEIVLGLGLGMALPIGEAALLDAAPRELSSDVGGLRSVATFMGSAFGTAMAGGVLLLALATTASAEIAAHPELSLPSDVHLSPTTVSFVSNDRLLETLSEPPWSLDAERARDAVLVNAEARLVALRAALAVLGLIAIASLLGVSTAPTRVAAWRRAGGSCAGLEHGRT